MDIAIRNMVEADIPVAVEIFQSAFNVSENKSREIRRILTLQPEAFFAATFRDAPAGMVEAVDYGPFAYVGMMAVHPKFQRRGIGHALMRHLLTWLDARGTPASLLDATELGAPVYAHFGFVERDQACVFQRHDAAHASHPPQGVHPLQPQDIQAVCDFDTPIFGADRSNVLRALLADSADRAFLVRDEAGQVSGYALAQLRRIGPWAARHPEDAQALLQAALSLPYDGIPTVIAPKANRAAVKLLEQFGFQLVRSNRHMRRGGTGTLSQRALIYGQTSFALG